MLVRDDGGDSSSDGIGGRGEVGTKGFGGRLETAEQFTSDWLYLSPLRGWFFLGLMGDFALASIPFSGPFNASCDPPTTEDCEEAEDKDAMGSAAEEELEDFFIFVTGRLRKLALTLCCVVL